MTSQGDRASDQMNRQDRRTWLLDGPLREPLWTVLRPLGRWPSQTGPLEGLWAIRGATRSTDECKPGEWWPVLIHPLDASAMHSVHSRVCSASSNLAYLLREQIRWLHGICRDMAGLRRLPWRTFLHRLCNCSNSVCASSFIAILFLPWLPSCISWANVSLFHPQCNAEIVMCTNAVVEVDILLFDVVINQEAIFCCCAVANFPCRIP